ncbi:hypothetical protein RSOLAG22IIIB_06583 [Rhizoctonia solani]|uniref:Uncharacterized protein n=1 Tax=Rhizoctonia solani TaxID=456999 RepID=A0A0K6GF25_9AGAM|nr:hypothetical protein RSOLAG22IIIB_06583 [Rhizoctonia solani]
MPCSSRQERHQARQERERLEAQRRKAERMEAHERRMRKQVEEAARSRVDRARRHHERVTEDARRRREKDVRYASSSSSQSSTSGYEYFYGAHYQNWSQPNPPPTDPIHDAISRYKAGLERMSQLVAAGVQLSFADISWPTVNPIHGTYEISKERVKHIALSESLHPGKDRRSRLFAFLLLWHPDKFVTKWMQYVRESDRAAVEEGVTMVAGIANDLLSGST